MLINNPKIKLQLRKNIERLDYLRIYAYLNYGGREATCQDS